MSFSDELKRYLGVWLPSNAITELESATTPLTGVKTSTYNENDDAISSAIALFGGVKTKFNLHLASGGTGLATSYALANNLKTVLNTHFAAAGTVLADLCAWAEAIRVAYTAHLADTTEHKVADTTNVLTAATATNHATLYLLVKDILDQYAAHNADAEVAGALTYHYIVNAATHVLASVAAPTSLAGAITRLTDAKAKYNAHDADAVSHATASLHQNSTALVAIGGQVHPTKAQAAITTANATTQATLYALAKACADAYKAHNDDDVLVADWVYHKAQGADNALIGVTTPTSLSAAITMLNDIKAKYNLHAVATTEHGIAGVVTAQADASVGTQEHPPQADTHVITAATPTNLATLITAVKDAIAKYNTHYTDSRLTVDWLYHEAQAGSAALSSSTDPTDIAACMSRLNDIKAKFNTHDADATGHTTGSLFQIATSDAAGGVTNTITVTGARSGDYCYINIVDGGTGSTELTATAPVCGTDNVLITFSKDPAADTIYTYQIFRNA